MVHKPLGLLAELTHRCPLGCPYCSNPLAFDARKDELDTATWVRVFSRIERERVGAIRAAERTAVGQLGEQAERLVHHCGTR